MDYKEKVIAILNSKELSKEQKEKLEEIFPELKESEDEKIREELIGHINNMKATTISSLREKQFESWIAWLEKQEMSYTKRDVDDAYLKGVTNTKNEIEKQYEATYQIRKDIATFIFNYRGDIKDRAKWMDYLGFKVSFVEKQGEQKDILEDAILDSNEDGLIAETIHYKKETQGEQKPADNVEPKFQNGQWIVWQNKFYKVNYNGCGYELIDQNGLSTSLEYGTIDESARLWNIDEDAKDGDFGWGTLYNIATHFFELGLKAQHDNWKVVDNINPPQADRNKIYCVFTKGRYILAKVIDHPKDEESLQWKCTEFPHHRYDMCEGDKYMQIV